MMIGAISTNHGNSFFCISVGIHGGGVLGAGVADVDPRAAVEEQAATALEHRVLDGGEEVGRELHDHAVPPMTTGVSGARRTRETWVPSTTTPLAELRSTSSTERSTSMRA